MGVENESPMPDGIGQTGVSIVASHKKIKRLPLNPLLGNNPWDCAPRERALWNRLILLIDSYRIVSCSRAKYLSAIGVGNVDSTCLDQSANGDHLM